MLHLILIRHAKSSWEIPGQSDHERSLNARGRGAAPLIARWLSKRSWRPDHALVSTARRAQETWALLREGLGEVPASAAPDLYEAAPEAILNVIRRAPPVGTLALVGHNPGLSETARRLLARPPTDPEFRKYPTAATTVMSFAGVVWADIDWGAGELLDFTTPKALVGTSR